MQKAVSERVQQALAKDDARNSSALYLSSSIAAAYVIATITFLAFTVYFSIVFGHARQLTDALDELQAA